MKKKTAKFTRPSWDQYFMQIAEVVRTRANCMTRQIGAIIVRDKRIIATGYNGSPMGVKNCYEGGCKRCTDRMKGKITSGNSLDSCVCLHAEQNALLQSAYHGISTKGAVVYTTFTPCTQCAKMLANSGIVKIVAKENYPDPVGRSLLRKSKIRFVVLGAKFSGRK